MTEKEFKALYIVNFVATYTATHIDKYQSRGGPGLRLAERHDCMEDATYLAECAWKTYQNRDEALAKELANTDGHDD